MSWRERATPVTATPAPVAGGWKARAVKVEAPEPQQQIPQNKARTILDQGLQGATFNFADEGMDAMGAAIAKGSDWFRDDENKLFKDKSLNDVYKDARGMSKERLSAQMEQNPEIAIPANIFGGLYTGGVAAGTKAGGAIANSLRAGGLKSGIAKGVGAGAVSGGAYGAGAADDGKGLEGAGEGAFYGGLIGGAVPIAGAAVSSTLKGTKNAIKGATARNVDELADAADTLRQGSNKAYKEMRDAGVVFTKSASDNIINKLDSALAKSGPLNSRIHGDTIAVMKDLRNQAKKGNLGLEDLDQFRQLFGDLAGNFSNKSNARTAGILKGQIDDVLDNLGNSAFQTGGKNAIEALKQGRAEFARTRKFETVSDIVKKSAGDANKLKRDLTSLLNNPKKTRGFKPEELKALKLAANQTTGEGLMKMVGKFGVDLGSGFSAGNTALPALGALGAGVGAGTGVGALVPIVGTAARQGQKYLARGKAENLLQTIERGGAGVRNSKSISPILSGPAGGAGGAINSQPATPLPPMPKPKVYPTKISIPAKPQQQSSNEAPDFLKRLAQVESGGNPNAKAATSSAEGLYQFTNKTWRDMVQKYGKQYGVTMNDRRDPEKSGIMAKLLTEENGKILKNRLGKEPNEAELYAAHFLGPKDATRLIKNADNKNITAASMFPEAARANKNIFFTNGRARRPAEVLALFEDKLRKAKIES